MHDGPRRVVAAGVVARGLAAAVGLIELEDERLEDFPEHLGIDGDVPIERRVLADGEVVFVEEVGEDALEDAVAEAEVGAAQQFFLALLAAVFVVEKSAVEKGHVADGARGVGDLRGEADEKREEELVVKARAVGLGGRVFGEAPREVVALAIEPAFALDEAKEEQPVQQRLRFLLDDFFRPVGVPFREVARDEVGHAAEVGEELFGDGFLVEGAAPRGEPGGAIRAVVGGPAEMREIEFEEGAEIAAAALPAKRGEPRLPRFFAVKMREGDALEIGGGAEEEEVFVLPRLERCGAAAIRHEAAEDLPERGAVDLLVGKLDEENAPRLPRPERAQLPDDATLQSLRRIFPEPQIAIAPVEGELVGGRIVGQRPVERIAEPGEEFVGGAEVGERHGVRTA